MKKPPDTGRELTPREMKELQKLVSSLKGAEWDNILVGDGSGSQWHRAAGWACVNITRMPLSVKPYWGSMNLGTNNVAEIMAYVHPLLAIQNITSPGRFRNVHIFTDSQYVQTSGDITGSGRNVTGNGALWEIFKSLRRFGLILHWHWIPRDTHPFNAFVDELSRNARLHTEAKDLYKKTRAGGLRLGGPANAK